MPYCLRFMSLTLLLLALAGCAASIGPAGVEAKVEQVAAAPIAVCATVVGQANQSLSQLKALLNAAP